MEIAVLAEPSCARCGDALTRADESRSALCRACRLAPPAFERAVAYGPYQDRMREAIHALKYERVSPAARRMGHMLAAAIAKLYGQAPGEMLVVPVPLHRSKHAQRGFNQARVLARHAVAALRKSHPAWKLALARRTLMRLRATETQAGLSPRQRRLNVRGAFHVALPDQVRDRHILLVDDILTTGATARSAALALKRAGAATVWVATLARAQRFGWDAAPAAPLDDGGAALPVELAGAEQSAEKLTLERFCNKGTASAGPQQRGSRLPGFSPCLAEKSETVGPGPSSAPSEGRATGPAGARDRSGSNAQKSRDTNPQLSGDSYRGQ